MSDAPPGWYPDPAAVGVTPPPLRYWDGLRWTEHRSDPIVPGAPGAPVWPTTPDGVRLAGWWHRVGATLLDQVFAGIVSVVFTLPAQISMQNRAQGLQDELQRRIDAGDDHVLSWFFHQYADLYRHELPWFVIPVVVVFIGQAAFTHLLGGTPGQLLTGLRVRLRERPGNLSWGLAALRLGVFQTVSSLLALAALMSGSLAALAVAGVLLFCWQLLDPLWAAWDQKRQTLHDKIVRTNVVRVR